MFALAGAVGLILASALVGALDVFAIGAVVSFWVLVAATGLILGRPGVDWQLPTEQLRRGAALALAVSRRETSRAAERLTGLGASAAHRPRHRPKADKADSGDGVAVGRPEGRPEPAPDEGRGSDPAGRARA